MKKGLLFISVAIFMASLAFVSTEPQTEDPHMQGFWLVLINANNEPVWSELYEGDNGYGRLGYYAHTIKLNDDEYGLYVANQEDTFVSFYFMIDGVRYGAEAEMEPAIFGDPTANPLIKESEKYYCIPIGHSIRFGVINEDGIFYAYAAQGYSSIDELSNGKQVTGVHYFNIDGQEIQEAHGTTIVVTTYSDGTTRTVKEKK